jgi:hypothetical protein
VAPTTPRQRPRYEINKKAFQCAQARRARLTERAMHQIERTQAICRAKGDSRRPKDRARCAPDRTVHDRHILEHVIALRNDLYHEASAFVPQGSIPDLKSLRKLPPDTEFHPRVVYVR